MQRHARHLHRCGIGTKTPTNALVVVGTVSANEFVGGGAGLTGLAASPWDTSGTNVYYNNGIVGIGTTSPTAKLDVNGNVAFGTNDSFSTLDLRDMTNASWRFNTTGNKLSFMNDDGGSFNEKMVIENTGNMGIGTTAPREIGRAHV